MHRFLLGFWMIAGAAGFGSLSLAQSVPHAVGVAHNGDVDLAYESFGQRRDSVAVIAVNGGPGLSHAYMMQNDLWQRVGRNHFVVLYDQRGTGKSKPLKGGAAQTMDAQVADLEAVRATLHLEKVVLVGDSYGGLLSMAYAVAHPEHVAKLVLSDSPPPNEKTMVHLLPDVIIQAHFLDRLDIARTGSEGDAVEDVDDLIAVGGVRQRFLGAKRLGREKAERARYHR